MSGVQSRRPQIGFGAALASQRWLAARPGQPVRIGQLAEDPTWIRFPEWTVREGLKGFAGRPLVFRGDVLGVLAATDTNVLSLGESATGKELVARAIHQRSRRASRPMVKVNCGSIPRDLFESEFFGHVRGSFTGAVRDRVGRFQLANGGTLFLDEVGEIPLDLQVKCFEFSKRASSSASAMRPPDGLMFGSLPPPGVICSTR